MRGARCEEGCRNGQRPAAGGMGEARTLGRWRRPLGFIHTNNSPNPILALLSGRFEARVYASERVAEYAAETPAGSRRPPATWVAWCDLITRGAGESPARKGAMASPDLEKESPESWSRGVRG
jgi:hypothetical protein